MPRRNAIGRIGFPALVVLLALACALLGLSGSKATMTLRPIPAQSTSAVAVDVELVIAVDISYSMDPEEQALQREGYINAIISPEFLSALREGMQARIAVAYFEWAGANEQRVVVPWSLIEGPESADAFAEAIRRAPYRRAMRTSVSGAILFGAQLFETSGYRGVRRVIDVSGDGTNNMGMPVTAARDAVLAKGITINGLPIMLKRPNASMLDIDNLDIYYEDCVIGGSGSFVVPIHERNQFKNATRTKLVMEVAGVIPPARAIPAASDAPRVNCLIGERQWQQRWGPGVDFR